MEFRRTLKPIFLISYTCINLFIVFPLHAQWGPREREGSVDFESSTLPLFIINTNGQRIVDSPRITAEMKVINNGTGHLHTLADPANEYDDRIVIELRGSSSARYLKQQYRLETRDSLGENLNVSLLGLPSENDWILNGPYEDETLIRNVLAYFLSNKIGRYASRTAFCELVLNDDYKGIYVLLEKIKRDKNRVDIARLDGDDVAGDSLTGGYIIKIDKEEGENNGGWRSTKGNPYQYDYPKPDDITIEQKEYIKNYFDTFENAMDVHWPADNTYLDIIDISSFVDHFILNEFCKNIDAYRISAFMYKDRDKNGGKLVMGPIWDMNLSMAKAFYAPDMGLWEGWQIDYGLTHPNDGYQIPDWWVKLAHSTYFESLAQQRWLKLRETVLHQDSLYADIDGFVQEISEAIDRNFQKWPDALPTGQTYTDMIQELKDWISLRLQWIDENIGGLDTVVGRQDRDIAGFRLDQNYPNPFNPNTTIPFFLSSSSPVEIGIYNVRGQRVSQLVVNVLAAGQHKIVWNARNVPSGVYFVKMQAEKITLVRKMLLIE
ncbi:CotH kinase family protein [candidate division KSB1 bacterium]|nr:CotH kinase family protein [candidate division KSB1 bacterium]